MEDNEELNDLGMAKKRDHKIMITDEANEIKGYQRAAKYFLNNCYKAGIVYEDR